MTPGNAVFSEGVGQQADLISRVQWTHQGFHAHKVTDHPAGIAIALELLQGLAPQLLSAIQGVDQHPRIKIEPHASAPGGPPPVLRRKQVPGCTLDVHVLVRKHYRFG